MSVAVGGPGVARGVAEEPPREPRLAARAGVEAGDALDAVADAFDGEGVRVEEELDIGLGADDPLLLGVLELLVGEVPGCTYLLNLRVLLGLLLLRLPLLLLGDRLDLELDPFSPARTRK